jgi:hypothetical protein
VSGPSRALGLAERLEVEAALENAFAPLRARRAGLGPTRVRAAVSWGRGGSEAAVPWAGTIRRISELGIAVGMSALVFAGSLTSVPPPGAPIPVSEVEVVDDMLVAPVRDVERWAVRIVPAPAEQDLRRILRWLKLGRDVRIEDSIDATILPPRPLPAKPPLPAVPAALPLPVLALFLTR